MPQPSIPRRARVGTVLVAATVLATATAGTAHAAAAVTCTAAALPLPEGVVDVRMADMDHTGRYVVGRGDTGAPAYDHTVVVWKDGAPSTFTVPGGSGSVEAVVADGAVAGTHTADDGERHGWVHADGVTTTLSDPPGQEVYVSDMNDDRFVVGTMSPVEGGGPDVPLLWRGIGSDPVALPLPGTATSGGASAIDEDGDIVGHVIVGGRTLPYLWERVPSGVYSGRQLTLPARTDSGAAVDIGGDWIVGSADGTAYGTVLWPTAPGAAPTWTNPVEATAVNPAGWTAGERTDRTGASLMINGYPYPLPSLGGGTVGGHEVVGISDDGGVVAGESGGDVLWSCA